MNKSTIAILVSVTLFTVLINNSFASCNNITESGMNVGIGVAIPTDKLHIENGNIRLETDYTNQSTFRGLFGTNTASDTFTSLGTTLHHYSLTWKDFDDIAGAPAAVLSGYHGVRFYSMGNERFRITPDGDVGIGTTSPYAKLTVNGVNKTTASSMGNLHVGTADGQATDKGGMITLGGRGNGSLVPYAYGAIAGRKLNSTSGDFTGYLSLGVSHSSCEIQEKMRIVGVSGNVGIGTTSPSEKLTVRGNILVENASGTPVAEIGEGLDYAEGFDVSQDGKVEAGTVLVLDELNPGKLMVSCQAYDFKVAGIVSGAKGLGSGVRLGVGKYDCDVALAGRVYCNVDATEHAIKVGDLLTTSNTPGHAMKAVNRLDAQGAILGKAMQSLEKGQKGQILVLVTLQ